MNLTPELNYLRGEIAEYAREYGLDFFNVVFEAMTFEQMNEVAAFGGFPTRYPHWRFGMEYDYMSKGYAYGLHKIYELVINNDPCYAYLLRSNSPVDQKLVIAHVYAHSDFFKNNYWFSKTNRKMMDEMANHGTRMRKYIERYGHETVEDFIDCCLSLENLIDLHAPFIRRKEEPDRRQAEEENNEAGELKLKSKPYMESFINPPEALRRQREEKKTRDTHRKDSFPAEPEKDVLLFLQKYAPLDPWQRNILSMLREEAYYFAPQAQTKIMNEGWAAYWHARIMTEKSLTDAEV
ncbi:MAG: SpoVR family protein, partial [Planctomycetota bacterium]